MQLAGKEDADRRALATVVERFLARELSAPIALMQMLIAAEDAGRVRAMLASRPEAHALVALYDANEAGCQRVAAMLASDVDRPPPAGGVEDGLAFAKRLFDWAVAQSEEASVALYSLGNPELLERATEEIVELLDAWHVLRGEPRALDLGCGIGRLLLPLAARGAHVTGVDVSPGMIEAARRRTAHLANVDCRAIEGRDLRMFGESAFDIVVSVDAFPYVVQAGLGLAANLFAEIGRVLGPGGTFALLNFSYRGDHAQDREDVRALAERAGLVVEVAGVTPFALWDGLAFRLRNP